MIDEETYEQQIYISYVSVSEAALALTRILATKEDRNKVLSLQKHDVLTAIKNELAVLIAEGV